MAWCKDPPSARRLAQLALVAVAVASAGTSEALPLLAGSTFAGELPLVVVPCAPATPSPRVLLAQRVLLETRSGGKTQPPTVPHWAGQWGPIVGSSSAQGGSFQQLAAQLFAAQTAQPLPNTAKATIEADQTDFEVTRYVIVRMSEATLEQLEAAAAHAIAAGTPQEGVLSTVEAVSLPEAVARLGPTPPPPDGWAALVIEDAYGGQQPGAFDTEFPTLVTMLTLRASATSDTFHEALLLAGRVCAGSAVQP